MGVPFLKLLLAGIDVAVLSLVVALLVSNCKAQLHGSRIWATAFHLLVLGWLTLRGVFWVLAITTHEEWESAFFGLLYWLPNPLQFGSFLLLPMAYSKVLSAEKEWQAKSLMVGRIYVSVVSGMLVYMVGFALVQAIRESRALQCVSDEDPEEAPQPCYVMDTASEAFRVLTSCCFFALAAGVAGYGYKMSKLTTSQNRAQLIYRPRALAALNCFLVAVFLSKGAYQIFSVTRLWHLPDIPLRGSEDVCLLNFCVFMVWDYLPTIWLLLVMEGTTGEHVSTSVAKAVFPSNYGDEYLRNLPDYGVFREIKAEAARDAARAKRTGSGAFTQGSHSPYACSETLEFSPESNSGLIDHSYGKNGHGTPFQGGGGLYANSAQSSSENLSQGGGSGRGSSNGYGLYGYGNGSAAAAGAASSVGSSLSGTAFVSTPPYTSESPDRRCRREHSDRGPFSWFLGFKRRSTLAELEAGDRRGGEPRGGIDARIREKGRYGRGGSSHGSSGSPYMWHASMAYSSSSNNKNSTSDREANANAGGNGIGEAGSRWSRRVFEGRACQQETSSLWETSDAASVSTCYPNVGELSRADVAPSLCGHGSAAENQGGAGDGGYGSVGNGFVAGMDRNGGAHPAYATAVPQQFHAVDRGSVRERDQPFAPVPVEPQSRAMRWGDANIAEFERQGRHTGRGYGGRRGDGDGSNPARAHDRPEQTVYHPGDSTEQERYGQRPRYAVQNVPTERRGAEDHESWPPGAVETETRAVARGVGQAIGGEFVLEERVGGASRPYYVPELYQQHQPQQQR